MRLTAGTSVLGRYRVIASLDPADKRSPVVVARDERLSCPVDLVIAPAPVGTVAGDLFARRVHAIAMLQHPLLPPILDMGIERNHTVVVYRHVDGQTLSVALSATMRGWSVRRRLQLAADLASALGLIHANGLCHGFFSPRSVCMEGDLATIVDLAWPFDPHADQADRAPEVRMGAAPTPRADVFALGRLLDRLLTGVMIEDRAHGARLARLVQRAMARDPRGRYPDGTALAQDITAELSRTPDVLPVRARARTVVPVPGTPVASVPARPLPVRRHSSGLPSLIFALAITLLPVVHVVMHDVPALFLPGHMYLYQRGWDHRYQQNQSPSWPGRWHERDRFGAPWHDDDP